MTEANANAGAGGYELKSELARFCLPAPQAHVQRHLAWANSICVLVLVLGLTGAKPAPAPLPPPKLAEESTPVVIETLPPPPTTLEPQKEEEPTDRNQPDAPDVVKVTIDSPAITFAVPTVGNVVVANAVAAAPSAAPLRTVVPMAHEPSALGNTGEGGDRPLPGKDDYPRLASQLGQQGRVVMLLTADEAGVITSVEVSKSSGYPILDRHASDWVKRRWTVSPGVRGRRFQAEFNYKLN